MDNGTVEKTETSLFYTVAPLKRPFYYLCFIPAAPLKRPLDLWIDSGAVGRGINIFYK
jgi:hypothetical protein